MNIKNIGKQKRDIEKIYPTKQFVEKLRRLADCLEKGKKFRIQIAGERINVPVDATINIEHERGKSSEEIEFQLNMEENVTLDLEFGSSLYPFNLNPVL